MNRLSLLPKIKANSGFFLMAISCAKSGTHLWQHCVAGIVRTTNLFVFEKRNVIVEYASLQYK